VVCGGNSNEIDVSIGVTNWIHRIWSADLRAPAYTQRGVAVCCSVLQRVAACCSVLHCVAVCCSVLQCGMRWQLLVSSVNYKVSYAEEPYLCR